MTMDYWIGIPNESFHFDLVDHFEGVVTNHPTCLHGRCSRRCDCARLPLCCDGLRRSPTSLGIVRDRAPRPRHCTARWAAHRSAGSDERERMDGDDSPSPLTKRPSDGGCCPATKASTVASSMSCHWVHVWPNVIARRPELGPVESTISHSPVEPAALDAMTPMRNDLRRCDGRKTDIKELRKSNAPLQSS